MPMITRRSAIKTLGLGVAAVGLGLTRETAVALDAKTAAFTLPPLPYGFDALEPYIDARTMELHHDKHHASYVKNLNAAIESEPSLSGKSLDSMLKDLGSVPEKVRTVVRNNGGGHANHTLLWETIGPGQSAPEGALLAAIERDFQTLDALKAALTKASMSVFGSGWAWLSVTPEKKLIVETTPNQDSPLSKGNVPILGIDVWEHAYYLKHQNVRADYVAAMFKVIRWDGVAKRFESAIA